MATSAYGRINRIYPNTTGAYIRLTDTNDDLPKDDLFWLALDHPNYRSVYAACLAGQMNRAKMKMRAEKDISKSEHAAIAYVCVDT